MALNALHAWRLEQFAEEFYDIQRSSVHDFRVEYSTLLYLYICDTMPCYLTFPPAFNTMQTSRKCPQFTFEKSSVNISNSTINIKAKIFNLK